MEQILILKSFATLTIATVGYVELYQAATMDQWSTCQYYVADDEKFAWTQENKSLLLNEN